LRVLVILFMAPLAIAFLLHQPVRAQSSCSSDGQRAPMALMERFINADCAHCWSAAETPRPSRGTVALDWIVPGTQGDDAPLSAVATREATERLHALGRDAPQAASTLTSRVGPPSALRLRVAQGPAVNGYIGASIELRQPGTLKDPVSAWLALVETIPAGVEGSPVERNLVRNVLNPAWTRSEQLSNSKSSRFTDYRAMSIPAGASTARLRVIGWIEDMQGRISVIAQTHCAAIDQR
jgi:hypothetical protein